MLMSLCNIIKRWSPIYIYQTDKELSTGHIYGFFENMITNGLKPKLLEANINSINGSDPVSVFS